MTSLPADQVTDGPLGPHLERYRAELAQLNYGRATINVYLRSIRRLCRLVEEHGVALGELTPDFAPHGSRRDLSPMPASGAHAGGRSGRCPR